MAKKNVFFRKILRKTLRTKNYLKYSIYKIKYKTDDKCIFFECFGGRNYTCNPKFIYEQMITMKEFKDYTFVWAFTKPDEHKIKPCLRTVIVKHNSNEYYKYVAKSKYWMVNSIINESITKKRDQVYVQCWHGTPLKKLRCDIDVTGASLNTLDEIKKRNDMDAKRFDYFLSPSKYATEKFVSAFNLDNLNKENIIIEQGYPRNESLFTFTSKDVKNIKKKLGLPVDKKVMFYMPTFRDNQHTSGVGYTYKLEIDFDSIQKKFAHEYVILFSSHYFVANSIDLTKYKDFIFNVSGYDDINELYIVSDLVITDYSSIFFDYANLKRPILFYMYDLDLYKGSLRDFYLDLNELPGPIAKTQKELEDNITNINKISKKYSSKYEKFNDKFNYLDDKDSTNRVIKELFKF